MLELVGLAQQTNCVHIGIGSFTKDALNSIATSSLTKDALNSIATGTSCQSARVFFLPQMQGWILQVLHVHGFSGVGLHCAYLVVACYLLYSREFDTFQKAWESLPNPNNQLVSSPSGSHAPVQRCAELSSCCSARLGRFFAQLNRSCATMQTFTSCK